MRKKSKPLSVALWPIARVKPYAKNARKLSDNAIAKVAKSIELYGWRQPIVVDRKGVVIAGHTRLLASKQLGLKEVPVHVATDLTEAAVKAYRLMDNRSHQESTWDDELLAGELRALTEIDYDLAFTGFEPRELDRLIMRDSVDPDEVPQVEALAISITGDLWLLGGHRLLCGDCSDPCAVASLLGDSKPVLMITDPPYGIELDSEWRDRAGLNSLPGKKRTPAIRAAAIAAPRYPAEPSYMKKRSAGHVQTSISGDTRADWADAFALVPSLEVAYVWHASLFTREVLDGLRRIGFLHHQQIIWNKGHAVLTRTHYWFQHEPCWYVRKKNAPWFGKAGQNSTIWESASPKFIMGGSDEEKFDHPTQKPVALVEKPILNHLREGGLVYEPFGGSGTCFIAAEKTRCHCYGVEIDPKYVDLIVRRWEAFTGKEATLEATGATFAATARSRAKVA